MAPRQKFRAGAQDPTGGRGGQLEPLAPGGHGVEVPRPWSAAGISELEERLASCEKAVAHTPQLLERVRAAERRAQVAEQMAQDAARGVGGRAEVIEKSVGALGQALIKAENEVSQLRLKVQAAERLGGQNQILMRQMEEGKAGRHNADIEELKLREEQSAGLLADSRAQVAALRAYCVCFPSHNNVRWIPTLPLSQTGRCDIHHNLRVVEFSRSAEQIDHVRSGLY